MWFGTGKRDCKNFRRDHVLIKMGEMSPHREIQSLPEFLRVLPRMRGEQEGLVKHCR
jgi:hypothetical protein